MKLRDAILFLKMDELRTACRNLGLSSEGQKSDLIARLLAKVEQVPVAESGARKARRTDEQSYSREAKMCPETYTNGASSRAFLRSEIGKHFRFTTFGMDWIKEQWRNGRYPSFDEFIHFWTTEYEDRRRGKDFVSKPELARVNFFRRVSGQRKVTKTELEQLWKKERSLRAQQALAILASHRT